MIFNAMLTNHGIYHGKYMYMQQWNTCQDIFLFVYYHSMSQLHVYLFYKEHISIVTFNIWMSYFGVIVKFIMFAVSFSVSSKGDLQCAILAGWFWWRGTGNHDDAKKCAYCFCLLCFLIPVIVFGNLTKKKAWTFWNCLFKSLILLIIVHV